MILGWLRIIYLFVSNNLVSRDHILVSWVLLRPSGKTKNLRMSFPLGMGSNYDYGDLVEFSFWGYIPDSNIIAHW